MENPTRYVYQRTEPQLFTVGFYDPDGKWHPDSDHDTRDEARLAVNYLNGGVVKGEVDEVFDNALNL